MDESYDDLPKAINVPINCKMEKSFYIKHLLKLPGSTLKRCKEFRQGNSKFLLEFADGDSPFPKRFSHFSPPNPQSIALRSWTGWGLAIVQSTKRLT